MKVIGLTGGIGSGKTTVAKQFRRLGVPVYIADEEAKKLTNRSKVIRQELTELLGEETYSDAGLNRKFVADIIFNDPTMLQAVNNIIHPKVRQHFKKWVGKQQGPYCIKEAAILFENGGYKECDQNILVVAPVNKRIERILQRDDTNVQEIKERMDNQWDDAKKMPLADYVIYNDLLENTEKQVVEIHKLILKNLDS